MADYTPDGKPVLDRGEPSRQIRAAQARVRKPQGPSDDAVPSVRTWQYSYSGKASGSGGFLAGALVLGAVILALVLGAVAITMVLWIALSLVVVGVIVALVRRIFGMGGRPRGGGDSERGPGSSKPG